MQFLAIVLLSLGAGVVYGFLHDQVTVRVCLEYFTIGHPPVFSTQSPTLLALGWGVIATWWVALPLGFALAVAARLGSLPKWSAKQVFGPLVILLSGMGAVATAAGAAGFLLVARGVVAIPPWVQTNIPAPHRVAFMADSWAHSASYLAGIVGAAFVCVYVWRARRRQAAN